MTEQLDTPGTRAPGRDVRLDPVLEFYAATTDEMRSPLNALAGWIEILAAGGEADRLEARAAARTALHRLRRLCDDAHDSAAVGLGRIQLHRRPVDIAALVRGVVASVPGARLGTVEDACVDGDPLRLAQILDTLLRATTTSDVVEVSVRVRGPWAELAISHDRVVAFEALQALFEPFSSPPRPADAVGLYVCRALVVAHGGDIGVGSDDGRTSVWVDLPLAGA